MEEFRDKKGKAWVLTAIGIFIGCVPIVSTASIHGWGEVPKRYSFYYYESKGLANPISLPGPFSTYIVALGFALALWAAGEPTEEQPDAWAFRAIGLSLLALSAFLSGGCYFDLQHMVPAGLGLAFLSWSFLGNAPKWRVPTRLFEVGRWIWIPGVLYLHYASAIAIPQPSDIEESGSIVQLVGGIGWATILLLALRACLVSGTLLLRGEAKISPSIWALRCVGFFLLVVATAEGQRASVVAYWMLPASTVGAYWVQPSSGFGPMIFGLCLLIGSYLLEWAIRRVRQHQIP